MMNFGDIIIYPLFGLCIAIPLTLLFIIVKSIARPQPVAKNKQRKTTTLKVVALVLALIYAGVTLYPFAHYLMGGYVQSTDPSQSYTPSPFDQMVLMTVATGALGLIFIGSLASVCLRTARSFENQHK